MPPGPRRFRAQDDVGKWGWPGTGRPGAGRGNAAPRRGAGPARRPWAAALEPYTHRARAGLRHDGARRNHESGSGRRRWFGPSWRSEEPTGGAAGAGGRSRRLQIHASQELPAPSAVRLTNLRAGER